VEGILVTCWLRYRVLRIVISPACEEFVYWVSEVMGLRDMILNFLMVERSPLPPGIRFHPTDVELVLHDLKKKVMGKRLRFDPISEVDIYKFPPWDLPGTQEDSYIYSFVYMISILCFFRVILTKMCFFPSSEKSILGSGDLKWYFYCPLEQKYSSGPRMNRTTKCGFWKVTGNARPVRHNEELVGSIKTLIFHEGSARGARTDWVLHEYRLEDQNLAERGILVMLGYLSIWVYYLFVESKAFLFDISFELDFSFVFEFIGNNLKID
jgi:hypothetical protein